jgi:adenosylcobinamide-GDP ribazoletransferase
VRGLSAAIAFLTRLPPPAPTLPATAASLPWFPVVGALVGLFAAVVYAAGRLVLPSLVAAALATAALILVTGALHEDGLADSVDAWGGGSSREETLRILRDPQHGTYGVLALALSVLLRVAALASLTPVAAVAVLPAVHAVSRGAMVGLLSATPATRHDGLGHSFAVHASAPQTTIALLVTAALGVGLLGPWFIAAAAVVIAVSWLVRRLALRRIGGITGDVLGATQQLSEIALLVSWAALGEAGWSVL